MQALKQLIKRFFPNLVYGKQRSVVAKENLLRHIDSLKGRPVSGLAGAGYDVFTYHGEDGIILYLLSQMKEVPPVFVDIGAGDCIKSNCAGLATHFGWQGLFVDQNASQIAIGKNFYKHIIRNGVSIEFAQEEITTANINEVLAASSVSGEIGLLSIDIDGNDYWIWKAIGNIRPRIVVIEAKVEFGTRDIVVPYGKHNHHSVDKMYNGASVEALRKLGKEKGYKLAGANQSGYNLFFVRDEESLPASSTPAILNDPATKNSVYAESFFATHTFVPG